MEKSNKNQQESTKLENINPVTGLNTTQELAVAHLVGGKSITEVASELQIDRGTLYNWMGKINFQSYRNKLCKEAQVRIENGLWALHDRAVEAVKNALTSKNEGVKLKTAIWLIEHLEEKQIGESDPRSAIKSLCWSNNFDFSSVGMSFDREKAKRLMKENNLQEY